MNILVYDSKEKYLLEYVKEFLDLLFKSLFSLHRKQKAGKLLNFVPWLWPAKCQTYLAKI